MILNQFDLRRLQLMRLNCAVLSWRRDIKSLQSLEKRMEDFLEHHDKEMTQRAGFRMTQDDFLSEMAALTSAQQQQKHELLQLKQQVLNLQQLELLAKTKNEAIEFNAT